MWIFALQKIKEHICKIIIIFPMMFIAMSCAQIEKISAPQTSIKNVVDIYNNYCPATNYNYSVTNEYRNETFICLYGPIDGDFYSRFVSLSPKPSDVIVIRSGGGEASSAMDVGDQLWRMGNLVIVDGICGSSCAYFIALGGKRLALTKNGVLGFHGGPATDEEVMKNKSISDHEKVISQYHRFRSFFKIRGIDISVTTEVPESLKSSSVDWKSRMWILDAAELKKYGVSNIEYCDSIYC